MRANRAIARFFLARAWSMYELRIHVGDTGARNQDVKTRDGRAIIATRVDLDLVRRVRAARAGSTSAGASA